MTYAAAQDLIDAFPQSDLVLLSDRDGEPDLIDSARITRAIEDASALIDSHIAKRVTLPLDPVPHVLKVTARDLAIHRLYANSGAVIPETIAAQHKAALSFLSDIARGHLSLGDETAGDEVVTSPGVVVIEGEDPAFTRKTLKGF